MSENDRTQHLMNFLLGQQAQLTATVAEIAQAQRRAEERWARTEESIRALLVIAESHEQEITANRKAQERLAESQARLAESQARTDKQMAETDERLNAFINFVERYLSSRRGGENGGDDR